MCNLCSGGGGGDGGCECGKVRAAVDEEGILAIPVPLHYFATPFGCMRHVAIALIKKVVPIGYNKRH